MVNRYVPAAKLCVRVQRTENWSALTAGSGAPVLQSKFTVLSSRHSTVGPVSAVLFQNSAFQPVIVGHTAPFTVSP